MQSTNTGARRNTTRKWCGPFGCFRSSKGTAAPAANAAANAAPANAARAANAAAAVAAARAARAANAKAARKAQVNAELAEMMAAAAGPGGAAVQGAKVPPIEEQLRLLEAEAEANAPAAVEGEDEEYNALQGELQEQTDKINRISRTLAETRFGGNRKKPSKLRKTRSKKSRRHRR